MRPKLLGKSVKSGPHQLPRLLRLPSKRLLDWGTANEFRNAVEIRQYHATALSATLGAPIVRASMGEGCRIPAVFLANSLFRAGRDYCTIRSL